LPGAQRVAGIEIWYEAEKASAQEIDPDRCPRHLVESIPEVDLQQHMIRVAGECSSHSQKNGLTATGDAHTVLPTRAERPFDGVRLVVFQAAACNFHEEISNENGAEATVRLGDRHKPTSVDCRSGRLRDLMTTRKARCEAIQLR
jgi:hypothetical protein